MTAVAISLFFFPNHRARLLKDYFFVTPRINQDAAASCVQACPPA